MSDISSRPRIVVGFDGSEGSQPALAWALREAVLRDAQLEVVRAWTPGDFGTDDDIAAYTLDHVRKEASDIIGDTAVAWIPVTDKGPAGKVLVAHSKGAEMLVVGCRGHGPLTGLLLGSVSAHVSTHAASEAVVIVRGQGATTS